jgi:hypothetical protein
MIRSRKMRWTGHVERIREKRNEYRILVGKEDRKRQLRRPTPGVSIILKWI